MPSKATYITIGVTLVAVLIALAVAGLVNKNVDSKPFCLN